MSKSLLKKPAAETPMILEIAGLCADVQAHVRIATERALRAGVRLLTLYRESGALADSPGGFRAALAAIGDTVPRSTAYRWMNAAGIVLARHQEITNEKDEYDPDELLLPGTDPAAWKQIDQILTEHSKGMSLRRLILGSADTSEDSRFDQLITREEAGDKNATEILELVSAGKLTLVQAIRSLGGKVNKEKHRTDPVYLDIDGKTGQPTGLFPKCLVTIANTFSRWDKLDEAARREVKASWKEVVSKLPKELR